MNPFEGWILSSNPADWAAWIGAIAAILASVIGGAGFFIALRALNRSREAAQAAAAALWITRYEHLNFVFSALARLGDTLRAFQGEVGQWPFSQFERSPRTLEVDHDDLRSARDRASLASPLLADAVEGLIIRVKDAQRLFRSLDSFNSDNRTPNEATFKRGLESVAAALEDYSTALNRANAERLQAKIALRRLGFPAG